MPEKIADWLISEYYSSLTRKINASLTYLHHTITWALTITIAGIGWIITGNDFPNEKGMLLSLILLIFISHFFVRAGKAYINVVRYASLQRRITYNKLGIHESLGANNISALTQHILSLDLEWSSPLRATTVIKKLLTEFGFGYFFVFTASITIYSLIKIPIILINFAFLKGTIIIIILEIVFGLIHSPYLRKVEVDLLAERYR